MGKPSRKWAIRTDGGDMVPVPSEREAYERCGEIGNLGKAVCTIIWVDNGQGLGWELYERIDH
jgi:hypothetical protein